MTLAQAFAALAINFGAETPIRNFRWRWFAESVEQAVRHADLPFDAIISLILSAANERDIKPEAVWEHVSKLYCSHFPPAHPASESILKLEEAGWEDLSGIITDDRPAGSRDQDRLMKASDGTFHLVTEHAQTNTPLSLTTRQIEPAEALAIYMKESAPEAIQAVWVGQRHKAHSEALDREDAVHETQALLELLTQSELLQRCGTLNGQERENIVAGLSSLQSSIIKRLRGEG